MTLPDVLFFAGLAMIVAAGFTVGTTVGLFACGIALIFCAVGIAAREHRQ